jgi:hypothetical protein
MIIVLEQSCLGGFFWFVFFFFLFNDLVCLSAFYAPTQLRSYREFIALLVGKDLKCPSAHYFRHKGIHEYNNRRTLR